MKLEQMSPEKQAAMVAEFAREVLGMTDGFTVSDFQQLIMKESGIFATDECIKHVFRNFDIDSSGEVTAEEFGTVISKLQPATLSQRRRFIIRKCLKYVPMYLAVFNLIASIWAAQANIQERELDGLSSKKVYAVAAVSDFIGNFGYVFLELSTQQASYESTLLIMTRFLRCVKSQIPKLIRRETSMKFNIPYHEETVDNDGNKKEESGFAELEKILEDLGNLEFTEVKLKRLFEKSDLYVSERRFAKIFRAIDTDYSGSVSVEELIAFSKTQEEEIYGTTGFEKDMIVLKKAIKKPTFYISWLFTVGSIFWMRLTLGADNTDAELLSFFLGLTCAFYLSAALGLMSLFFISMTASTEQVDYVETVLRKTAIVFSAESESLTLDASSFHSKQASDNFYSSDEDLGFDDSRHSSVISGPRHSGIHSISGSRHSGIHSINSTTTSTRKTVVMRDSLLTQAKNAMHVGFTAGIADRLSLMKEDNGRNKEAQRKGAMMFFKVVDIDESSEVDEMELFASLVSLGMLVPTNVFSTIYRRIDRNGDGSIELEEFVNYIGNLKPFRSTKERLFMTIVSMVKTLSFYLILVKVFAGSCQTAAAYGVDLDQELRMNLFLMGSIGWGIGSIYLFAAHPKTKGNLFDLIEATTFLFKEAIVQESLEYKLTKERHLKMDKLSKEIQLLAEESERTSDDEAILEISGRTPAEDETMVSKKQEEESQHHFRIKMDGSVVNC